MCSVGGRCTTCACIFEADLRSRCVYFALPIEALKGIFLGGGPSARGGGRILGCEGTAQEEGREGRLELVETSQVDLNSFHTVSFCWIAASRSKFCKKKTFDSFVG